MYILSCEIITNLAVELESSMTGNATAANLLWLYLYGDNRDINGEYTTPLLLTDRLRDLAPTATGPTVNINISDYGRRHSVRAISVV